MKNAIFVIIAAGILMAISMAFWQYTLKDYMPTGLPKNYVPVPVQTKIDVSGNTAGRPVLLHFFNPNCPCSRFNLDHVKRIAKKYKHQIDVKLVLQVPDSLYDWEALREDIQLDTDYLIDHDGRMAKKCGVYATPQAVLLDEQANLYYRGNYNRAKYCTNPQSNFAQMAIDSLLAGKPSPIFNLAATQAYGCQLPQQTFSYE